MTIASTLGDVRLEGLDDQKKYYLEGLRAAKSYRNSLKTKMNRGKYLAVVLKGITAIGGVIITLTILPNVLTIIGVVIFLAPIVDYVLSNVNKLAAIVPAYYVIDNTISSQDGLLRVTKIKADRLKDQGNESEADRVISDFYLSSTEQLNTVTSEVREAVQKADVKAIMALAHTS
jgi:hypothetical protein